MSYDVGIGINGKKFVLKESVESVFHATNGNTKTGDCVNFNFPIEYTCVHNCNCYLDGACYACNGAYNFLSNQARYSENYNFFVNSTEDEFCNAINEYIKNSGLTLFRYFTCGDIPNVVFVKYMVRIAKENPNVRFWSYTKKYSIVNAYCKLYGIDSIPSNLTIIFSHWLNDDGTYYKMENPFNFPTSEFIPLGKEELLNTVTHVCPCSDPNVIATCATCDHPCYKLNHGESMALVEHSTKRTKERDKEIKLAKETLKGRK